MEKKITFEKKVAASEERYLSKDMTAKVGILGRGGAGLQSKFPVKHVKYWRTQSYRPMGRAGELYWQGVVDE